MKLFRITMILAAEAMAKLCSDHADAIEAIAPVDRDPAKRGKRKPPRRVTAEALTQFKELKEQGHTYSEIGRRTGYSDTCVHAYLSGQRKVYK